jgi:Protein of unknown function (DUF3072)
MIGAQASYLKKLSEEAGEPDAYDENLTKAEESARIDALRQDEIRKVNSKSPTILAGHSPRM